MTQDRRFENGIVVIIKYLSKQCLTLRGSFDVLNNSQYKNFLKQVELLLNSILYNVGYLWCQLI